MKWTKEQLAKLREGIMDWYDVPLSEFPMPTTADVWRERVAAFLNEKHILIQCMHEFNGAFKELIDVLFDVWNAALEERDKFEDLLKDAQKKEKAALQKKKRGLFER